MGESNNRDSTLRATQDSLPFIVLGLGPVIGLVIAGAIAVSLLAVAFWTFGPPQPETGTIVSMGLVESNTGSQPVAVVLIGQREATVPLPRINNCFAGKQIMLVHQRRLLSSETA